MRKFCTVFVVIVLVIFTQGCDSSDAQNGFNNGTLVGNYGYSLRGFIEFPPKSADEVGIFNADGLGNITGTGMTVVDGVEILTATYSNCEYEVNPDGTVLVDPCTRMDENGTFSLRLFMVLGENGRGARILVLPTGDPLTDVFGTVNLLGGAERH